MNKIEMLLEAARQRSELSELHDDTTLEPALAAIYLGISTKKLEEMRLASSRSDRDPVGPPFIKLVDRRSTGRNQSVFYKLGDLRAYQQSLKVSSSFEACLKSGLGEWVKEQHMFYVQANGAGGSIIVAATNDFDSIEERDLHFSKLWSGEFGADGFSLFNAQAKDWRDPVKREQVRAAWRELLNRELQATGQGIR